MSARKIKLLDGLNHSVGPEYDPAYEGSRRLIVLRHVSDWFRDMHTVLGDAKLAAIFMAMDIGRLEGRPMDASAIAVMTGLARTTVVRKLKALEAQGKVRWDSIGRRKIPNLTGYHDWDALFNRMICRVAMLESDLTKLDNS